MIYFAFYRASAGNLIDWLIALATWSRFSHVEIVIEQPSQEMKNAFCFSASPRDSGTRYAIIDVTDRSKWEVIPIGWLQANKVLSFCDKEMGCKYDWLGVFAFIIPFLRTSRTRWFCSELASAVVEDQGYLTPKRHSKMSPEDFLEWIVSLKPLLNT